MNTNKNRKIDQPYQKLYRKKQDNKQYYLLITV